MSKILKVFWFKGRINRTEYFISVLLTWPIAYLVRDLFSGNPPEWLILLIIYPYFSQGAKRCQDRGINGLFIINPANFIFNFSNKGTKGVNEYGQEPDGIFLNN